MNLSFPVHLTGNAPLRRLQSTLLLIAVLISITGNGQSVGISSSSITPDASSILELRTTTKGLLTPRMTTTERNAISSPATGLIIYNTTSNAFNFYNGSGWIALASGSSAVNSVSGTTNRISIGGTSTDPTVDISSSYVGQSSITTLGTIGTGTWNGTTIAIANGGTGQTSAANAFNALSPLTTLGDIIYGSGTNANARLAGNTTSTKKFLTQTGNGSVSAAPSWGTVTASDVGLGNVENTALSTWTGSTNITTLGTIATGTWNGTVIADNKIASVLTGKTYNGLTLTALSTGFTIAGGTTSKTLTVPLDASVSGTNTGDQTITLTGDVTGSGTGSFATTIGNGKVTNAMLAGSIDLTTKVTGTLPVSNGGTGQTSASAAFNSLSPVTTLGDIIYGSGTNTSTRLAGNTTSTKKFLSQTGNGSVSAAPSWVTVTTADIGLGNVENTALSTWTGSTNITTLGTITSGTWNGTAIADNKIASALTGKTYNGLTLTAQTTGFTIAGGTTSKTLTVGSDASVSGTNTGDQTITLTGDVTGSGTGSFATAIGNLKVTNAMLAGSIDLTTKVTGILPIANGGTNSTATPTDGGIAYGDGTSHQFTAAGTSGKILQSAGAGAPVWTEGGTMMLSGLSNNTAVNNTTLYFTIIGGVAGAASDVQAGLRTLFSRAGTIKNLYVKLSAALGSGKTGTVTVMKNGVATSLVATLSVGPVSFTDLSNTVSVAAGDEIGIKITTTGNVKFSWAADFTY